MYSLHSRMMNLIWDVVLIEKILKLIAFMDFVQLYE
jgi:hypothetical protein